MKPKKSVNLKNVWLALSLMVILVAGITTPVHAAKNQLTAFSKNSPADGAFLTSTSVTLSWGYSAGTNSYTWCITPQGGTICEKEGTTRGTTVTVNGLTTGTIYSWQVSAEDLENGVDANNGVPWTFHVTAPGSFSKTGPANGSSNQLSNVTFTWESSPGVVNYEFCYGLDGGCINTYNTGTDTFKTINNLAPNTTYYWKVRALNNFGATYANGETPTWMFTTAPKPGAFHKSQPSSNEEVYIPTEGAQKHFQWTGAENADGYYFCFDETNDNQCNGQNWQIIPGGSQVDHYVTVYPAKTYYWQVMAYNSANYVTISDSGTWFSFSTYSPDHFNKLGPGNTAQVGLNANLGWSRSRGAVSYAYCYDTIDDNKCNTEWVNAANASFATIVNLSPHTDYYWQIVARDQYNHFTEADSDSWFSFSANPPPSGFGKGNPTNNTNGLPGTLTFSWSPSSDATVYEYCVNTTTECTQWNYNGTNTSAEVNGLEPESVYFWQVRALNTFGSMDADAGVWWSFETQSDFVSPVTPPITQTATFLSQGNYDGWVLESTETSNKGGALNNKSKLFLVGDDAANRQYRGILSFDTSSLPENAVVTKMTLKVKKAGLVGTNPFKTHKGLVVDIQKLNFGTSPKLQKPDFQVKGSKDFAGQFSNKAVSGWYTAELGSEAYAYFNTSGVTQFRLRFNKDDNNDLGADYFKFYSGNAGISSGPQLIVEYYVP